MRVLITGATGFVGAHLIAHLLAAEPEVAIVGTAHPGHGDAPVEDGRVQIVPCDILAAGGQAIADLVREVRPDQVYHLAGAASGAATDRAAVFAVNVEGTRHVLAAVGAHAPQGRVLLTSTGYVYGACDPSRPAREEDPLPAGVGVYAESKRAAEELVRGSGLGVIVRSFNHTGPGQSTAFAVPAFASQIVAIERGLSSALLVGNVESWRDFLDVRDVVVAYRLALGAGVLGQTYNVCSGVAVRLSEIVGMLCGLASVGVRVVSDASRQRASDIAYSVGDPSRLRSLTGWAPVIPLRQTLQDTLDWWRRHEGTP